MVEVCPQPDYLAMHFAGNYGLLFPGYDTRDQGTDRCSGIFPGRCAVEVRRSTVVIGTG